MIFILENHRIDNATRRCRSDKTKWFYQMLASDVIADPRTGIQVRDARVFRARQCTLKENPTDFPLVDRGLTVGFLRFGMNAHKPFFICSTTLFGKIGVNLSTFRPLPWYNTCNDPWKGAFDLPDQVNKTPCCLGLLAHVDAGRGVPHFTAQVLFQSFPFAVSGLY